MPALTFEDFDALTAEGSQRASAPARTSRALTLEDFDKLTASKPELDGAARVGGAITSGLVSGLAGVAGLPADILRGGQAALDYAQSIGQSRSYDDVAAENAKSALVSPETLDRFGGAGIKRSVMSALPEALDYKPQNAGERAIETASSFLSGGAPFGALRSAGALGAQVALPAATSIGAGGAAAFAGLGPTGMALAEGAGAVLGGGAGAFAQSRAAPISAIMRDKARTLDPVALERAQGLMDDAAARGGRLSIDEAYAQVTGQNNNPLTASRTVVERTPEGSAVFGPLMAQRPDQVRRMAEASLREVSPTLRSPGELGPLIQGEARAVLNSGPEGQQMAQAMREAGPRISPMQAGDIIQPELGTLRDRLALARSDADNINYRAAEQAPERIGVDRYLLGERPGEPKVTRLEYRRPQFDERAPAPLEKPTFVADGGDGPGESLARFIKRNGGLELSDDVKAAGLGEMPVPGVGYVAKEGGKSIDGHWRTALKEAGFLQRDADGYTTSDITNLLIRKLQNEQRGVPSYAYNGQRRAGNTVGAQADEYKSNLSLWETRLDDDLVKAGISPESLHPDVRSRTLGALMRGEDKDPLDAYERTVSAMRENPEPFVKSTAVEEPIYAPRFGQVNPQGTLDYIDGQLARGAKGAIADALEQAKSLLMERGGGQADFSVAGLSEARKSINALLDGAPRPVQERLLQVRNRLDADLSVAPEYEVARSTHEALSRPLDPFDPQNPIGRAVERNPLTDRYVTAPEQVPGLLNTPSTAREFNGLAPPNARAAQERYVRTQILDGVTDARGTVNPDALLTAIRDNHDLLTAYPDVRQRLINVATARYGLARAEQSTIIGRISRDPDMEVALRELFNEAPRPETAAEITRSVRQLAGRNPQATAELLRMQMESVLNTARHTLIPGENARQGAKFSVALRGHPQQRENFEAFMRALPNGEQRLRGFDRFMDILEATGKAPAAQSITAFATRELQDASQMGMLPKLALAGKTAGLSLKRQLEQTAERVALGKNMAQMANLLVRPDSGRVLAELARVPARASRAQILALRLSYMGRQGAGRED